MIKVDRPPAPPSLDLTDRQSAASLERQVILDHLAQHQELPNTKSFKVYSSPPVKELLISMFKGKCAYCEIFTSAGFDGDVEHYRPKGGVTDADLVRFKHPGYWWLAMVWDNLVLSCQHCNQSRRQLIHQPGQDEAAIVRELLERRLRTTGKKNRFPVQGNAWVTDHQADIGTEAALLHTPALLGPRIRANEEWRRAIPYCRLAGGTRSRPQALEHLRDFGRELPAKSARHAGELAV